jgi:hypothetical protein
MLTSISTTMKLTHILYTSSPFSYNGHGSTVLLTVSVFMLTCVASTVTKTHPALNFSVLAVLRALGTITFPFVVRVLTSIATPMFEAHAKYTSTTSTYQSTCFAV